MNQRKKEDALKSNNGGKQEQNLGDKAQDAGGGARDAAMDPGKSASRQDESGNKFPESGAGAAGGQRGSDAECGDQADQDAGAEDGQQQNSGSGDNNMANHNFNEIDSGIGCSDMAYYRALMSGGRVTRNTIRREEDQPTTGARATQGGAASSRTNRHLTPSQLMRSRQEELQQKLQIEREQKKQIKKQ